MSCEVHVRFCEGREVQLLPATHLKQQLPILLKAKVREHRGGVPTMTADVITS